MHNKKTITVKLTPELYSELEIYRKNNQQTKSSILRRALIELIRT